MGLRISCKAKDLMAYMKWITSKLGRDFKLINITNDVSYIIGQSGGNEHE